VRLVPRDLQARVLAFPDLRDPWVRLDPRDPWVRLDPRDLPVLMALRDLRDLSDLPVLMALQDPRDLSDLRDLRVLRVLSKPMRSRLLLKKIHDQECEYCN
jgi:hypothetical protein